MKNEDFLLIIIVFIILEIATLFCLGQEIDSQDEQIKQLKQSLAEQIQEVEVYRGILEEYQTEGIINE